MSDLGVRGLRIDTWLGRATRTQPDLQIEELGPSTDAIWPVGGNYTEYIWRA
jgi:hypothetical protein